MKKILFILIYLTMYMTAIGQGVGNFIWVTSPPTSNPGINGAKFAVLTTTYEWYEHVSGTSWVKSGDRVQTILGCSAPLYVPAKNQSRLVVNGCNPTQMYYFRGPTIADWDLLSGGTTYTAGTGISIASGVISNTGDLSNTNELQALSQGATTITLSNGGGTVNVDPSITNEIQTLSISGQNLSISGGNTVTIPTSGGGGVAVLKYDNYRLPATDIKIPGRGINANESVANYNFASVDDHLYYYSTVAYGTGSTDFGGWLANGTSGDSIAVTLPYWVVIGDSQAEGHPTRHGRLHPGSNTFDAFYADQPGQLSYTLATLTKMRWFNHGIGGETTANVWARWRRDVLGESFNPSDGRGSRTLRANTKPMGVVVVAGINDFYAGSNNNVYHVQTNLENMARSARDNGIQCVFLNCPGDEINTAVQNRKIDSLNAWMASGVLQSYGAAIVDYNTWWRDPAYNDNMHGQSLIIDDIHPTAAGYDSLAYYVFRSAKLPVLDSFTIYTRLSPTSPISGYSRPNSISVQGRTYAISSDMATVSMLNSRMVWDSVWIKVLASTSVTGTSTTGISHIVWHIANDTIGVVGRNNPLYTGYIGSTTNIWTRSGSVLTPTTGTDRVAIGTTTTEASTVLLQNRGTTTDGTKSAVFENSAGTDAFSVWNNGRVAINHTNASYNLHLRGNAAFEASASDYTFINGSTYQVFGNLPLFQLQSSAVNTGGNGFTTMNWGFNGSEMYMQPAGNTQGANLPITFKRKSGNVLWKVDLNRNFVGYGNPVYQGAQVDFSLANRGMWWPSTHADSLNVGGGFGGLTIYDENNNLYQGVVNNVRHNFVTNLSSDTHTSGDVLAWNGSGWLSTTNEIKGSATLDFPSTANNTNSDLTLTVTGAAVGDPVTVAPATAAISNHSCYTAWVSGINTVTVRFNHYGTAGPTDPVSGIFQVIVHKY